MKMQIIGVSTTEQNRRFLDLPVRLYKNEPNYIRPLDKDVEEVFDPKKNKTFRHGEVVRWLLHDGKQDIGRIAAFVNKRYKNKGDDVKVGGIGFFECTNNFEAAKTLLDTARQWLEEKGMEAMDGPINFGERERWWGMVAEGFQEPLYCMNYNFPYYNDLFAAYGFKIFFEQICLTVDPKVDMPKKLMDRHAYFKERKEFTVRTIKKNDLNKYAQDFAKVYNSAWAGHGGLKEMQPAQAVRMFESMKPVIDEKLVYFTYENEEPIAMYLNLPDLNQWFKHLDGKFGLLQKLYFLLMKKFKPNSKFVGLVFGVVPKWQGKGIDSFMVGEASKIVKKLSYKDFEMQWIGDFNPKMLNVANALGDMRMSRKLITYRYLFDRNKEFKRHPIIS